MSNDPTVHPVHKAINKSLTILGAERRLFFMACVLGATTFNLFGVANEYILTKWLSERVALRFAEAGLPVVVVNPAFPFGPRDAVPTPTGPPEAV